MKDKPGLKLSMTERIPGTKKYKTWIRAEQDGKDTWNQEIWNLDHELSRTERIPGTMKYPRAEQDGKDTWSQRISSLDSVKITFEMSNMKSTKI